MTDEAKALVERSVELAVNATCIADEYADVLRPKQIERLYAMRDLIETQAREIERLRIALQGISEFGGRHTGHGYSCHLLARAALGESQ